MELKSNTPAKTILTIFRPEGAVADPLKINIPVAMV